MTDEQLSPDSTRKARRLKRNTILVLLLLLASVALCLAQIWVRVELFADSGITGPFEQAGSTSATVVALGLALAASIFALLLSGRIFRYILGTLIVLISIALGLSLAQIVTDPLGFVASRLAERAGISGPGLESLIQSIELTVWPWVVFALVVLIALTAIMLLLTAHRWPLPSSKYSREDESGDYQATWGRFEVEDDPDER